MPYPGLLNPERPPLQQSISDLYFLWRHPNTVLSQSLWGLQVLVHIKLFEPSEHLWQVWGLILNVNSPFLSSCWGFSFALACGVSFFGWIQHSLVDGCSAASYNFGGLKGEDEYTSFYSAVFKRFCIGTWNVRSMNQGKLQVVKQDTARHFRNQ